LAIFQNRLLATSLHLDSEMRQAAKAMIPEEVKPLMAIIAKIHITIRQRMNNKALFVGIYQGRTDVGIADILRFAILGFALLLTPDGWASTAVVIVRQNSITVGADSKAHGVHGEERIKRCKLAATSDMVFANDGILGDSSGQFIDVAKDIMSSSHDVTSALANFDKIMILRLSTVATLLAITDPAYFKTRINKSIHDVAFGIYGFPGTRVIGQSYILEQSPRGLFLVRPYEIPFRIRPNPDRRCVAACPDGTALPMGFVDEIDAYIDNQPLYTRTSDPIDAARLFIGLEIKAHPDKVGPPIEILKIDGSGPHWVQDEQSCQAGNIPKRKAQDKKASK
jgi:hypothetical protein